MARVILRHVLLKNHDLMEVMVIQNTFGSGINFL
jgi:hypothetical protein